MQSWHDELEEEHEHEHERTFIIHDHANDRDHDWGAACALLSVGSRFVRLQLLQTLECPSLTYYITYYIHLLDSIYMAMASVFVSVLRTV